MKKWITQRLGPMGPRVFLGLTLVLHRHQWLDLRVPGGWLVLSWRYRRPWCYVSRDATPHNARWLFGRANYMRLR